MFDKPKKPTLQIAAKTDGLARRRPPPPATTIDASQTTPKRHKLALLTWAVVYPLITGLLVVLEPWLTGLALPLRTLLLTAILVPAMVYLAMPLATARLEGWLSSKAFF